MKNFDKLAKAGLADKKAFTKPEQNAVNRLSAATVDKIIAAAKAKGFTGSAGQR